MTIESPDTPSPSAQYFCIFFYSTAIQLPPSPCLQVDSLVQESLGPASLCQNIIKRREPGREELSTGEGGGDRGYWLLPILATGTLAPWSKHLTVGQLWCSVVLMGYNAIYWVRLKQQKCGLPNEIWLAPCWWCVYVEQLQNAWQSRTKNSKSVICFNHTHKV